MSIFYPIAMPGDPGSMTGVAGRHGLPVGLPTGLLGCLYTGLLAGLLAGAWLCALPGAAAAAQGAEVSRGDPPPGDSASVLTLDGRGPMPGTVLEYRVREPAGDVVVPPRLTLMATDAGGTRYVMQLIPGDADEPFAAPFDLGPASAPGQGKDKGKHEGERGGAYGERSMLTVETEDEAYVSSAGTVVVTATGAGTFTAEIAAPAFERLSGDGGSDDPENKAPSLSLKGRAAGAWTLTCFAAGQQDQGPVAGAANARGAAKGAWGVDGGATQWFLDERLQSPYCSRFRDLRPD